MRKLIGKIAWCVLAIAAMIFAAWLLVSYAEILAENLSENPTYHNWNFFIMYMESF